MHHPPFKGLVKMPLIIMSRSTLDIAKCTFFDLQINDYKLPYSCI